MAFTRGCLFAKVQGGTVQGPQVASTPIRVGSQSSPVGAWVATTMKLLLNDGTPGPVVGLDVLVSVFPLAGQGESGNVNLNLTALDDLRATRPNDYTAIRDSYLNNGIVELTLETPDGFRPICVHLRSLVSARYNYNKSANTANPGVDPNFNFGTDKPDEYVTEFAPNRYKLPVVTWTKSVLPTGVPATPVVGGSCLLRITRKFTTLSGENGQSAPYSVVSDLMAHITLV